MADLLVNLRIKAIENVSSVARRVRDQLQQTARLTDVMGRRAGRQLMFAAERASKTWSKAGDIRNAAEGVASFARTTRQALIAPIRSFEQFESQMTQVRVKLGDVSDETFQRMIDQAKNLGNTTRFSAVEAGQGLELLTQAGFSAENAMGALPTVLNLAQAQALPMAAAAEVMTTALAGFNLETSQATRVADVFSRAADASNAGVLDLAETMSYAAPVASSLGMSIERTAALAGVLADAGIKGSRGGTALNAILQSLAGASRGPGMEIMKRLGVDTKDAAGNLRPMEEILTELMRSTERFGSGQKTAIFAKVFGREAAPAVTKLMDSIKSGKLVELSAKMQDATGATQRAKDMMAQTSEEVSKGLSSAIDGLAIEVGTQLAPAFNALRQGLTAALNAITGWVKRNPGWTKLILGTVAALSALASILAGVLFTATTVFATKGLLILMGGFGGLAKLLLGPVVLGLKAIIAPLIAVAIKMWAALAPALLLAAPFIAVAAAIAAVTFAIVQLVRHWDQLNVKEGLQGMWESLKDAGFLKTAGGLLGLSNVAQEGEFFDEKSGQWIPQSEAVERGLTGPKRVGAASGGGSRTEVGGTLNIKIDQEGRARVASVAQSGPMDLDVDAGLAMAGGM